MRALFAQAREIVDYAVEAAVGLQSELAEPGRAAALAVHLKELEGRADLVARTLLEDMHGSFVSPLDREMLETLLRRLEAVVDAVEAAGERIWLYGLATRRPEARELGRVLTESTRKIAAAFVALAEGHGATLRALVIEVNRLENEADGLLRLALARLFRDGSDPIEVLKWKEIYESIEAGIDCCEEVANILEAIALEYDILS